MTLTENMNNLHDVCEQLEELFKQIDDIRYYQHHLEDEVHTTLGDDDTYAMMIEAITEEIDDVHRHVFLASKMAKRALIFWDDMEEDDQ